MGPPILFACHHDGAGITRTVQALGIIRREEDIEHSSSNVNAQQDCRL